MSDVVESNAILKLDIGEKGGIRRIPVRRLWDASGSVSYDKLVSCAVKYAFGSARPDWYDVSVTYTDGDGDVIVVSSDEELVEAFAQAGGTPPTLRATASVAKKEGAEVETKDGSTAETAGAIPTETKAAPSEPEAPAGSAGAPKLNALPEALLSVLAGAVVALQRRANAGSSVATPETETTNSRSADVEAFFASAEGTAAKEEIKSCVSEVTEVVAEEEEEKPVKIEDESPVRTETEDVLDVGVVAKEEDPVTLSEAPKAEPEATDEGEEKKPARSRELPTGLDPFFIHGRHTCDGCLCTPIIGIRYHAINLPDYDLCQVCIHNYKGDDIQFEPMEIDRDRSLQHRWARKELRRARQARFNGGGRRGRQGRQMRPHEAFRELDAQLKDALRGSAMDFNLFSVPDYPQTQKEEKCAETKVESESVASESVSVASEVTGVTVSGSSKTTQVEVFDSSASKEEERTESLVVEDEAAEKSVKDEDEGAEKSEKDDSSVELNSSLRSFCVDETEATPRSSRSRKTASPREVSSSFADDAEDSGTIAREIGVALDRYAEAISSIVDEVDQRVGQSDSEDGEQVDSTDEDDASSTTSSIGSILSIPVEAEKGSIEVATEEAFGVDVEDEDEIETATSPPAAGVTIVEPDAEEGGEEASQDNEWHVLQDEMIANAAQVLGSALFESDLSHSVDNLSRPAVTAQASTGGSSVASSSVSSFARVSRGVSDVGSEVGSVAEITSAVNSPVSPALLARWDKELKQLHEVGFMDDRRSIDALEHLEAARLGVEAGEEEASDAITMDDVVNFLLTNTVH